MAQFRNAWTWTLGAVLAAGIFAGGGGCERQPESLEPLGGGAEAPPDQPSGQAGRELGPPQHALVGQAAPSFTAGLLDGSQLELDDHAGDVVLLDFWATWCPPCVEALPKIARVASGLRGEGVAFYAVNVGEDAEAVEEFLRQHGLDVPVLMDRRSQIAGAYQATAIPQTVLIGQDGTVQAVHVGLSADLESTLQRQLRTLLDGQDLAGR